MTDMIGRTLAGRYEIHELIGEGGMAEVYKARQIQLDRLVAIKVMHRFLTKDKTFKSRFEQEAQLGARLAHPNIIHVYDFEANEIERMYFIAVELIVGPSLNVVLTDLSENNQRMSITEVLRIVSDVGSALGYAHSQGMIHRDVKPANILLENGQRVVLTDFGIAKLMNSNYGATKLTTSEALLGTPAYMAPEQALGNAGDARSDLYSLGVMMYQMITGRLPFWADSPIALAMKHVHDVPKAPRTIDPDIPLKLNNVIMRTMLKDPAERYQSADQFLADLAALDNGKGAALVRKAAPLQAMPAERERPATINLDSPSYTTINFEPGENSSPRVVIPAVEPTEATPRRRGRGFLVSFSVVALLPILALGAFLAGNSSLNHTEATATVDVNGTSVAVAATDESVAATQVVLDATGTAQSFTVTPAPCMATASKSTLVLTGPTGSALGYLVADVPVTGSIQTKGSNQRWWRVDYNQKTGWVPDKNVSVTGNCDTVPAAESPALLPAYTASPTPTNVPKASATGVPANNFNSNSNGNQGNNNSSGGGGTSGGGTTGGGYSPTNTPIPPTAIPTTAVPATPVPNTPVPTIAPTIDSGGATGGGTTGGGTTGDTSAGGTTGGSTTGDTSAGGTTGGSTTSGGTTGDTSAGGTTGGSTTSGGTTGDTSAGGTTGGGSTTGDTSAGGTTGGGTTGGGTTGGSTTGDTSAGGTTGGGTTGGGTTGGSTSGSSAASTSGGGTSGGGTSGGSTSGGSTSGGSTSGGSTTGGSTTGDTSAGTTG